MATSKSRLRSSSLRICSIEAPPSMRLDPARLVARDLHVGSPHPLEETPGLRTRNDRAARAAAASRLRLTSYEQSKKNVRSGLSAPCAAWASWPDQRLGDAISGALVGDRGVAEAIADDPLAALERRRDHLPYVSRRARRKSAAFPRADPCARKARARAPSRRAAFRRARRVTTTRRPASRSRWAIHGCGSTFPRRRHLRA
jgi:hypothetical protein